MTTTTTIVELRASTEAGIYAVVYRRRRNRGVLKLLDGTIAEIPIPDQRCDAPAHLDECLPVAIDGGIATIHHVQLGLVASFLLLQGVFLLPGGEVVAVYGAEVVPIG